MQSCVRSLLARILETRERLGRTTIVAISGIDCAGKSTFAAQLAAGLRERGKDVVVIDGDDFNRPRNERLPYPAEDSDYGFAYGQLADELLVPARENIRVATRLRVKDWAADVWRQCDFVVEPGAIVLVEGVFLFTPPLRRLFDLAVWLEIPFGDALKRALRRDAVAMGGPSGVRHRYETRYFPAQRLHLERDLPQESANLCVRALGEPADSA